MEEDEVDISYIKPLSFNPAQYLFALFLQTVVKAVLLWGRGTGKTKVIAWLIRTISTKMPRSLWGMQGATFQQIQTRIFPSLLEGLESLGYKRDVHYFIGRRPPKGYALPYQCPTKFDHCIFVLGPNYTSIGIVLLSQDREGMSRGLNLDGVFTDEALTIDEKKYNQETKITNRGNLVYFKGTRMHHAQFFFSSMPFGTGGEFLLKESKYYADDGINIEQLWNTIVDLQIEYLNESGRDQRKEIWKEISHLQGNLQMYVSKDGVYFSLANVFDNIHNVGYRYIKSLQEDLPELIFLIEVMNKFIHKVQQGFYPLFDRNVHGYKGHWDSSLYAEKSYALELNKKWDSRDDADCIPQIGLEMGVDFGGSINWLVIGQELQSINRFNFIKNLYRKSPKILDHVVDDFCTYYQHHQRKVVNIHPDAQGNQKVPNSANTYVEHTEYLLKQKGWAVNVASRAQKNPFHHEKHMLWNRLLLMRDDYLPVIGFNVVNCNELVTVMEKTPSLDGKDNRIHKDKSSEKKLKDNREEATDVTDAGDNIIWNKYRRFLKYARFPTSIQSGIRK